MQISKENITPSGRFGRRCRLQTAREFRLTMHARRHGNGHFVLFASPFTTGAPQDTRPQPPLSRLGLAVAKTAGHSPARARLRRLFREAFRCIRPELTVPTDLVALLRQPWPAADLASVVAEMRRSARAMRLLN